MFRNSANDSFSIKQLLNAESFPHAVSTVQLLETHISWIVLTGYFAYKIKKPVKFDFVNYSTSEARQQFCILELQFNRRFAPEIYLDVVPIYTVDGHFKVGSDATLPDNTTKPIEYAVKMRQFPQDAIVATRLTHPQMTGEAVAQFGSYLAKFHDSIEAAKSDVDFVQVDRIGKDALANFETLRDAFAKEARGRQLVRLETWTADQFKKCSSAFYQRLANGNVRQCHGDLHLKNIIQLDDHLIAFDGIEFNKEFQWIDVLSELAFPVMDFMARGRADLGWRLLNAYLEIQGEYEHLELLRFYLVYRAMVRAKVSWLNPRNRKSSTNSGAYLSQSDALAGPWDKYLTTAMYLAFQRKPTLTIMHGFSGSGKSTTAMRVIDHEGGVRIRSDVERQRIAKTITTNEKYSTETSDWIYARLNELAKLILNAGISVVVDAAFLKLKQRLSFLELARNLGVDFQIINCEATYDELCLRIRQRHGDASEATVEVLRMQMQSHDPLTTSELDFAKARAI